MRLLSVRDPVPCAKKTKLDQVTARKIRKEDVVPYDLSSSRPRLPHLDSVRLLAFLLVFLNHSIGLKLGWVGVDLFFVLSGFLITGILLDSEGRPGYFKTFYGRRAFRILPPYYLFLGILWWAQLDQVRDNWPWYAVFCGNFFDAIHLSPQGGAISVAWSLSIEEQFYLLWPLAVAKLSRLSLRRLLWSMLLLTPIIRGIATLFLPKYYPIYVLLPFRTDLLAAGALLAYYWRFNRPTLQQFRGRALATAFVSAGLFAVLAWRLPTFRTAANSLIFNMAGYSLIMVSMATFLWSVLMLPSGRAQSILSHPIPAYIGRLTYTMYLFHSPMIGNVAPWLLGRDSSPLMSTLAAFLLTLAFAVASYYLMEKPFAMLKDRWFPEHRRPAGLERPGDLEAKTNQAA